MPNPLALAIMGGSVAGGYAGYRARRNDSNMDMSDKAGTTVMSALMGGAVAMGATAVGWGRIGSGVMKAGKSATMVGKGLMHSKTILGAKAFQIPKAARGPLGVLALGVAAIGAVAASAGSRVPNEREEYGSNENFGQIGSGIRERMGMLGATGDMVFGLNNSRHG